MKNYLRHADKLEVPQVKEVGTYRQLITNSNNNRRIMKVLNLPMEHFYRVVWWSAIVVMAAITVGIIRYG